MISGLSNASAGSLSWRVLNGETTIGTGAAAEEAKKKRPGALDRSHLPDDPTDQTEADKLEIQEEQSNKALKSYFGAATTFDSTVRMLGSLGSTWGMVDGLFAGGPSGWIAVGAGAGAALTITDAAYQVKTAAVNRNAAAAIDGTLTMVQGAGVMMCAMGLGRIPVFIAAGAAVGKMIHGMYQAAAAQKAKEAAKKADKERKEHGNAPATPAPPAEKPSSGLSAKTIGSIAWKSLTAQPVLSAPPSPKPEPTQAERRKIEEVEAKTKLQTYYDGAVVTDGALHTFGSLAGYYGLVTGLLGTGPAGWLSVGAGAGAALMVTDAAYQVKSAAINRDLSAAVDGTFSMVAGTGIMLTAMGLGRAPVMVSAAAIAGKMAYGAYRAMVSAKEKSAQHKPVSQPTPAPAPSPQTRAA